METTKVGIRQFRENLSNYLLESVEPVAITRHGDIIGHYFPVRPRRIEVETTIDQAHYQSSVAVAPSYPDEEEIMEEFKHLHRLDKVLRRTGVDLSGRPMDNAQKVARFLRVHKGAWHCDSCISTATGVKPSNQVNQIARPLGEARADFERLPQRQCAICKKGRTCTMAFEV